MAAHRRQYKMKIIGVITDNSKNASVQILSYEIRSQVDHIMGASMDGHEYFVAFGADSAAHSLLSSIPNVTLLPHPHSPGKVKPHHLAALAHLPSVSTASTAHDLHDAIHKHLGGLHPFDPEVI